MVKFDTNVSLYYNAHIMNYMHWQLNKTAGAFSAIRTSFYLPRQAYIYFFANAMS